MALTVIYSGPSQACLEREVAELSRQRNSYSRAHELAHHALAEIEAGASNADSVFEGLVAALAQHDVGKASLVWRRFVVAEQGVFLIAPEPLPVARSAPSLPAWRADTFAGLPEPAWFSRDTPAVVAAAPVSGTQDIRLPYREPLQVSFRLFAGSGRLFGAARDALLRFLDMLRRMVRLLNGAIGCRTQLIFQSGLRHRPNVLAFALIILAVCRRYGRRSEPDDHASLITRRHLVSPGSCLRS
jgi:hypothetical protein